ncbi:hypothetical protein AMATHDRAFT_54468 [Amanita thiersii Skay4041]|uniref:WD repeat-containing protein JIP5 n=1 Tax=Amanita thiersii Skay4041 TaxID=703135 RepID=A0A2A9NTM0_9AGAR|nr:hypothetical protein AMATHDRAFT_54468 [Amanita thiersii Skay4041]
MPSLFSTGDDDGVIKLWDPRQRDPLRTYTQHFDYITDFLWLDDKRHLVATSADGTLSVMDVKSKKQEPIVQSEDQEDELLSIVAIKGGTKVAVGTQLGILSIFNRNKGWADCVDRVPGHPLSIDALCNLPPNVPNVDASNTILTGSSDGFVRAVQLFPTKLLGVVTDHGEWPVERIAIGGGRGQLSLDRNSDGSVVKNRSSGIDGDDSPEEDEEENQGQRLWWVGSIGHEDTLRMSNLEAFFSRAKKTGASSSFNDEGALSNEVENEETEAEVGQDEEGDRCDTVDRAGNSGDDSDEPKPKKRKRKPGKDPLKVKRGKGKSGVVVDVTFFNDL